MKGILFKPDIIKAIMEGRKTQTRRLQGLDRINEYPDEWIYKGACSDVSEIYSRNRHWFQHQDGRICPACVEVKEEKK